MAPSWNSVYRELEATEDEQALTARIVELFEWAVKENRDTELAQLARLTIDRRLLDVIKPLQALKRATRRPPDALKWTVDSVGSLRNHARCLCRQTTHHDVRYLWPGGLEKVSEDVDHQRWITTSIHRCTVCRKLWRLVDVGGDYGRSPSRRWSKVRRGEQRRARPQGGSGGRRAARPRSKARPKTKTKTKPAPEPEETIDCSVCGAIPAGSAHVDTPFEQSNTIPPEAEQLTLYKAPFGDIRDRQLLVCPGCGRYFLQTGDSEYNGSGMSSWRWLHRKTADEVAEHVAAADRTHAYQLGQWEERQPELRAQLGEGGTRRTRAEAADRVRIGLKYGFDIRPLEPELALAVAQTEPHPKSNLLGRLQELLAKARAETPENH